MITKEQFEAVCDRMEECSLGLVHLCKEVGISKRSFYEYRKTSEEAEKRYARSKYLQLDYIAEETLDIADDGANDLMRIVRGDESYEVERKEVVNRSRLRVDARKWLLSKLNPKKYGDKIDITSDGDKLQAPPSVLTIQIAKDKDDASD